MTSGHDEKGPEENDLSPSEEQQDAAPSPEDAPPSEAEAPPMTAAPEADASEADASEADASEADADAEVGAQDDPAGESAFVSQFPTDGPDLEGPRLVEFDPLEELEQDLKDTTARLKTVSAAYQKLQGEFNHFKGRTERQLELKQTILKGDVVKGLFEPLENLRRSIDAMKQGEADQAWIDGMQAVNKNFMDAFRALGLEEVQPHQGEALDTRWHEAISLMSVSDEQLEGRVVQVYERGYRIGQRCIRPAKVLVGSYTPPAEETVAEGEDQVGEA